MQPPANAVLSWGRPVYPWGSFPLVQRGSSCCRKAGQYQSTSGGPQSPSSHPLRPFQDLLPTESRNCPDQVSRALPPVGAGHRRRTRVREGRPSPDPWRPWPASQAPSLLCPLQPPLTIHSNRACQLFLPPFACVLPPPRPKAMPLTPLPPGRGPWLCCGPCGVCCGSHEAACCLPQQLVWWWAGHGSPLMWAEVKQRSQLSAPREALRRRREPQSWPGCWVPGTGTGALTAGWFSAPFHRRVNRG